MSKVWKGLKKAFKVVLKVVKVVAIVVVIAAAVYFTAGAAAGAFGSLALAGATAGTAVGSAVASFAMAAQGFFTAIAGYAASYLQGVGSLWQNGVKAFTGASAGAPATGEALASSVGMGGSNVAMGTAAAPGTTLAGGAAAAGGEVAAQTALSEGGQGVLGKIGSSLKDMSVTDKLLLAKTGADVIGGFTAPTEKEKAEAQRTHVGAFYGRDAKGGGGGIVDIGSGGAQTVFTPEVARPAPTAQSLFESRTSVATNPEGRIFDPKRAATNPLDLFPGLQPAGA